MSVEPFWHELGSPTYKFVDWDWYEWAACQGHDSKWFFPEGGENVIFAKRICAQCPVRGECLWTALHNHEEDAVWGGLSRNERSDILRYDGWQELTPQELLMKYPVMYRKLVILPQFGLQ